MNAEDTNASGRPSRSSAFNPELSPAEFESEFWGRVLERRPFYEDVLRRQAEALAKTGHYQELVALDRRLVQLRPTDAVLHYNLACTLTRLGEFVEALAMLKASLRLGYDDFGHIDTDPDLDPLRDLPEFKLLLKRRRQRG
jgi:tetratricopeptide (TPR) repeat protein